ncbi:VTT domain-containing protein [Lentilactobacillus kisonensis]|nr:VTT domain-containing protein [Lentilactobacillus kisonensis]EHO54536.1 SNARE-like domain protein [Lentilactobacillus kisonensis F0435]
MITALLASGLHIQSLLPELMETYGSLIYVGLFGVIFSETGLVFCPFLPGDSILFLCGSLSVLAGSLRIEILMPLFVLAAISGDFVNFKIGSRIAHHLKRKTKFTRLIKKLPLAKSHQFFAHHGNLAVSIGRFVPVIRTMIPFTAGLSKMPTKTFLVYNVVGGLVWVLGVTLAGYFFGTVPFIKAHFELIFIGIAVASVLPIVLMALKKRYFGNNKQLM